MDPCESLSRLFWPMFDDGGNKYMYYVNKFAVFSIYVQSNADVFHTFEYLCCLHIPVKFSLVFTHFPRVHIRIK